MQGLADAVFGVCGPDFGALGILLGRLSVLLKPRALRSKLPLYPIYIFFSVPLSLLRQAERVVHFLEQVVPWIGRICGSFGHNEDTQPKLLALGHRRKHGLQTAVSDNVFQ
ncbi:MAG: hypothetical protein QOF41_1255 [Methylobacteriaceae bacterium]|nr:hypothetical protein [Methylobacteriaceae bacterium]